MVPAGGPVDQTLRDLTNLCQPGDLFVDGGNSYYRDDLRRADELAPHGFIYMDAGTSGGIWGREIGYALMVGGSDEGYARIEPVVRALAPDNGYAHTGPVGSGHFAKMVHNGIEYGLMQAYAEGFSILERAPFNFDLAGLAELWNHGSVIRSWLLELAARALTEDPRLEGIRGYVEDTGEGRWTVAAAISEDVPAPVITQALYTRFRSREQEDFGDKFVAVLRREFGGHAVKAAAPKSG
jgi:6-phosphogluconate dehydrogenase